MGNGLIVEEAGAASETTPRYLLPTAYPEFRWLRERGDVSGTCTCSTFTLDMVSLRIAGLLGSWKGQL